MALLRDVILEWPVLEDVILEWPVLEDVILEWSFRGRRFSIIFCHCRHHFVGTSF